jgi:hypothetical protein
MACAFYLFMQLLLILMFVTFPRVAGFAPISSSLNGLLGYVGPHTSRDLRANRMAVQLHVAAAKVTEADADKVIQTAKSKINCDKSVKDCVGTLEKVVSVVG